MRGRELSAGDPLLTVDHRLERIGSVRVEPTTEATVYNLVVQGAKTYFVGRTPILVHSCDTTLNVVDWAGLARGASATPAGARAMAKPFVVYASLLPGLGLVDMGAAEPTVRWLRCLDVPSWAMRIGVRDDALTFLDAPGHQVLLVPLPLFRAVAAGSRACETPEPGLVHHIRLDEHEMPYEGLSSGDDLFVSYFQTNQLVRYRWTPSFAGTPPSLVRVRDWQLASPSGKGASALRLFDGKVFVADAGWSCEDGNRCPTLYGESHLYAVDPGPPSFAPVGPAAYPEAINAAGLYLHPATEALYVLAAGGPSGGESSLRRLVGTWALGPALRLPRNAKAFKAFPLDADHFAVMQIGGDHLFVVDARTDHLAAIARFDGSRFAAVPVGVAELAERTSADLQDLVAEPRTPHRYVLVDSKGEQLARIAFDPRTLSFSVLGRTSLRGEGRHTTPSWGLWLP